MRAFIACVPPRAVTDNLADLCLEIRRIAPALRCEHAGKLHFTLEFLGEKSDDWMLDCRAALAAELASFPSFSVSIGRLGAFPGRANPRIIWAGSHPEENVRLGELALRVKAVSVRLGHTPDPKPFHPHITLTRIKTRLAPDAAARIAQIAFTPLTFECNALSVIKSTLSPSGSSYEVLQVIPLLHRADHP